MNKPQVILDGAGRPAFAVIPWREYERLSNGEAEALMSDEELYDRAKAEGGESYPVDVADRLLAGENPIRVYRDHRGMKQGDLAAAAGIHPVYLSQIETGRRTGSTRTLAAIAEALGVTVDDLI
ncbi:MAG: helix-turn-helix transcriptional regulator [Nitrospinae bacterium]|nr:helix-turn-helix transcriptional regulator [Nitrospinota bacterium]